MISYLTLAFALYSSVVAFIYAVSNKFGEILSEETNLLVADRFRKVRFSTLAQNWYINATRVLDWIFQFKRKGRFHIASKSRIFLWALFFVLVLSAYGELLRQLNFDPFWQFISLQACSSEKLGCWLSIALSLFSPRIIHEGLFNNGLSSAIVAFPVAVLTISIVDFANISKARTLIDWTYGWRARFICLTAILDLVFTFLISAGLTLIISGIFMILAGYIVPYIASLYFIALYGKVDPDYIGLYDVYGYSLGLIAVSVTLSFITSLFVVSIYVLTAALVAGMRVLYAFDNANRSIVRYVNMKKPIMIIAILLILVFTVIYWPTVLLLSLF